MFVISRGQFGSGYHSTVVAKFDQVGRGERAFRLHLFLHFSSIVVIVVWVARMSRVLVLRRLVAYILGVSRGCC